MISVITPCLNICKDGRLEYFKKMMESIHHQTWTDLEHLVIDGGSTDGTVEILEQYQRKGWIHYLVSEKDSGLYSAINKGIKASHGEYIHIMNTDDFFLDLDYFRKSMKVLENREYDFIHADKVIKSREGKPDYIKKGDEMVGFFRMPFRHQTMIVNRNIFGEIGLFNEKYQIAADYKFALQILLTGKKGYYIPETVLYSLDGGVSSNREKCIQEVSQVIFDTYGYQNNLTIGDCSAIYQRMITPDLYSKILSNIKDQKILDSLKICYLQSVSQRD